ncbi:class 1 fructose-bisphosphatase [Bacteriovoracaceae bacterium]|nr:class 1 fructose-bisphosphatase [Bacteriovoracaceae bacterium]
MLLKNKGSFVSNNIAPLQTLEGYINDKQKLHSDSRGVFSDILRSIGLAGKIIASKIRKAGLNGTLGLHGNINVQGENQMKLDVMSNEIMKNSLSQNPYIAGIASEEEENIVIFPMQDTNGGDRYIILFDPLDGSSNIDANVSVGTIFSIYKYQNSPNDPTLKDFLQAGKNQVAAGYVIYGSSTMFVYSTGKGVHGFTLAPELGEFLLSHPDITIPDKLKCFSSNDANYPKWTRAAQQFADESRFGPSNPSSRYIGSLVADFHRNLLYGGVFMYPEEAHSGKCRLRLMYECSPMAFLAENAGGKAVAGTENILDIVPRHLHQKVPLIIGNTKEVLRYKELFEQHQINAIGHSESTHTTTPL